jgi:hypothetical protein
MSANKAVTVLRSPSNACGSGGSAATRTSDFVAEPLLDADEVGSSEVPHCPQNLNAAGLSNPHFEHLLPSGAAQLPQNFIPCGFSVPQLEQIGT